MIAVDTSSFIAYFNGDPGRDVTIIEATFAQKQAVLPPVVLAELLSLPELPKPVRILTKTLPLLPLGDGYWERAGYLRSKVLARGYKARLADSLIAQSCLDHGISLVTRDKDFRHFARVAELQLLCLE